MPSIFCLAIFPRAPFAQPMPPAETLLPRLPRVPIMPPAIWKANGIKYSGANKQITASSPENTFNDEVVFEIVTESTLAIAKITATIG